MAAAGLPTPAFRVVTSASEAIRAARAIGLPVIVKPLRGSGSVGVQACASAPEAGSHAASLLAEQPAGEAPGVLVESLIDGPEFSVEVFSGRIVGITRKHLGAPPHFVEIGHDYPADIDDDDARGLLHVVRRATGVLGLGWGPLHWELRVREGRAYAMEVNPRLAGGFIPELVRLAHGTDLIRSTLKLVVGQRVDLSPTRGRHASIRFLLAPRAGRFAAVDGVAQARALDHVSSAMLYRTVGDMLSRNGDFRDRIGHVIADADGAQAAAAAAELGRDTIRVSVIDQTITDDVDDAVLPLVGVGL
jgi:argininosuccinate lyase